MKVSCCNWIANFAHNDDTGWTTIDAQCATCTDVVINDEQDVVGWIIARLLGIFGKSNRLGCNHVDALPRTNINATFTHDAFALINMNELLWFNSLGKIGSINFNELILVRPFWHWWVGVSLCHFGLGLAHQWSAV